jgi:SAM-dependent methyltransferase
MDIDNHKQIIKKLKEIYNKAASEYGISSRAVLWDDQQTQYFRFAELIKNLDLNDSDKTILDVGCGNCELYKFLNFMGFRGHYTGYDINENLLKQARERFNNIDIRCIDIMTEKSPDRFNYVLLSGLFNTNVRQSLDWVYSFLKKMYELCTEIMIFDAISTYVNYREEEMFYLDPVGTLAFCIENLSHRVTLAHHNLPYNFTISVYRNENWRSIGKKHRGRT